MLHDALQRVSSVVPQKPTLPVLANYLLTASDGRLTVSGTDMDMAITTTIECEVEGEGAVTVNAKRFYSIVRELPEGQVSIDVSGEKVTVEFSGGSASIMGMSAADYPQVRNEITGNEVVLSGNDLIEMVDKTIFSVATERTRVALTGVYWRVSKEETMMVATDGHRLSLFEKKTGNENDQLTEAIVPPKVLTQASRIVSQDNEMAKVIFGDGSILFDFADTRVYSKLIDGPYPDFRNVIPENNTKHVFVSRGDFEAAVRRVSQVSSSITHQIRLSVAPNSMEISTSNADIGGEAREKLVANYEGDPITAGFNSQFLLDILRKIETDEVVIELELATSACLIKPVTKEDRGENLYLIMPLRLNE